MNQIIVDVEMRILHEWVPNGTIDAWTQYRRLYRREYMTGQYSVEVRFEWSEWEKLPVVETPYETHRHS